MPSDEITPRTATRADYYESVATAAEVAHEALTDYPEDCDTEYDAVSGMAYVCYYSDVMDALGRLQDD